MSQEGIWNDRERFIRLYRELIRVHNEILANLIRGIDSEAPRALGVKEGKLTTGIWSETMKAREYVRGRAKELENVLNDMKAWLRYLPEEKKEEEEEKREEEEKKEEEEERREEEPKEIPSNIIDLHSKFRRKLDGAFKYIMELRDKCDPKNVPGPGKFKKSNWDKWRKLRDMQSAANSFINTYKDIKPITLDPNDFYLFIIDLSQRKRMIRVDWFHWLPESINQIIKLKGEVEKEKEEVAKIEGVTEDFLKRYDYVTKELLGSETMKLFEDLKELYHDIIVESENLRKK